MKQLLVLLFSTVLLFSVFCQSGDEYRTLPPLDEDEEIILRPDQSPRFPGCENALDNVAEKEKCAQKEFLTYIYSNLKFPVEARKKKVSGQVVIQFVVAFDGTIRNVTVLRSLEPSCDLAAIKVIESMNDLDDLWIPGILNDEYVNVQYILPLSFKVEQ